MVAYDKVLASLPEAIAVLDPQRVILAINPSLLRTLRMTEDAVIGQNLADLLPDVARLIPDDGEYIPLGSDIFINGRYVELSTTPLLDDDDTPLGLTLILRDTTVRRHTEMALYTNERRYRTLFENSKDAIFIVGLDADFGIVIANPQAASLLNIELGVLLQKDILRFIPRIQRSYFQNYIERLIEGETIALHETAFLREDGAEVLVEVSLTLVRDAEGSPQHVQIIARDITVRKQAELIMQNRLYELAIMREVDEEVNRTLDVESVMDVSLGAAMRLSQADGGFIALTIGDDVIIQQVAGLYTQAIIGQRIQYDVGISGRILETHQAERIINVALDPQYIEDIAGAEALIGVPLVSQDRLIGLIILETRDAARFDENVFQLLQLMMSRIAVALENARLYQHMIGHVDELQALNDQLMKAESLKTDMIRIANHDLKNPLSIARGYLDLLIMDQDKFSPEYAEFFATMQNALDRMFGILDDFLSVEAITQRAAGATMLELDLRDLVVRAVDEYRPQALAKNQKLSSDLVDPGVAWILGDESQLYEAITNLISNGIKYTPDHGHIQVELQLSEYNTISYLVQDNGYGIPTDRQENLFKPFYRSQTDETQTIEGTGLGLHLVKNIIERHDGEMIFESVYREGSMFGFRLPCITPETPA